MKILFFDDFRLGVLKGDSVVDVSDAVKDIPHVGPHDLISGLIERFASYRKNLEDTVAKGAGIALNKVKIRPPLPRPVNIDCMAANYMEDGTREKPATINAFHKSPGCIIGNGEVMVLPDEPAANFDTEAEMAVVIGKHAWKVTQADAMDYVFGYMNFMDGSARGLPTSANSFYQVKSRATFAPIGPYLVTKDEVPDPHNVQIRLWVNGECTQNYNTSDMAYKIPRCIEWITSIHPLEPGDILGLGTNHLGLSAIMDGDKIELECDGLGRLHITIRDDLKRTWERGTRKQRAAQGLKGRPKQLTGKYSQPQ